MSIAERALAGHTTNLPHAQHLRSGICEVAAPPSPVVPARRLAGRARSLAVAADGCAAAALASAASLSPSPDKRGPPPMDSLSLQALAGTIGNGSIATGSTSNDNSSTAAAAPTPGTRFDSSSTNFSSQVVASLSPAAVQRLPVPLQTLQPLGAAVAAAAAPPPGRKSLRSRWPRAAAEAALAFTGTVTVAADLNAQDGIHTASGSTSIPAEEVQRSGSNGSSSRSISSSPQADVLGTDEFRVAYQGVPGAYSEMAAVKAYPNCCPVPCNQFEDAFKAVEQWLVDKAVLPIENSLGGSIHRNYDLLLRHRLHIVGEVQLAVNHCLLALPGTQVKDIRRVLSHPQALAQVEMTLTRMGSMVREAVDDTAGAAKTVAQERLQNVAAVASLRAAEIYGLDVLAEGIQDDPDNITRFLVLAREPILPANDRPFKTSIVFTLERGPGVLFKALSVFALRDINLTKIESRPQREKPLLLYPNPSAAAPQWPSPTSDAAATLASDSLPSQASAAASSSYQMFDYLFYIDFQASLAEQRAQNALRHLQEFAPFLRVLGSYPMDLSSNARL